MTISPSPSFTMPGTLSTMSDASQADRQRLEQLMQDHRRLLVDRRSEPHACDSPPLRRVCLHAHSHVVEQAHLPMSERRVRSVWLPSLDAVQNASDDRGLPALSALGIGRLVCALVAGRDVILLCACDHCWRCHHIVLAKLVQAALARVLPSGRALA
ncbi:MAG: hypothetical protein WCD86_02105 [Ktedonobacteraceae bacterium]